MAPCTQAALQVAVLPGDRRHRPRHPARPLLSGDRRGDEAAGRRLHQADQDDHRADHLLHGRRRHRRHGGHEEGRQDRRLCAALLRDRQHDRADRRPRHRQRRAAGRGHEHRPGDARHQGHRRLHEARPDAEHDRLPAQRHSRTPSSTRSPRARSCRCCCSRCCSASRCTSSAAAARWCSTASRRSRTCCSRSSAHHEGRADRRVRRDGVHHRQVRRRLAAVARQADGHVLPDLPGVHPRRARARSRASHGFSILEVHPLHQGGAADRARHVVVRVGAAADDGEAGEPRRARSRRSGSSSRPAIRSTSTARRST